LVVMMVALQAGRLTVVARFDELAHWIRGRV
jgi:hypothetical protein